MPQVNSFCSPSRLFSQQFEAILARTRIISVILTPRSMNLILFHAKNTQMFSKQSKSNPPRSSRINPTKPYRQHNNDVIFPHIIDSNPNISLL